MKIEATRLDVFTEHEMAQIVMTFAAIKKAARWNPLFGFWIGLLVVIQGVVFITEYELSYQIFDYIAGDEGYWNTHLMAVTGILFIIGFHVLAYNQPDNLAVRVVNLISVVFLPLYALGLGFLIMSILYEDGLAEMIAAAQEFTLFVAEVVIPKGWLEMFFETFASPVSVLLFALATGGLAVVNLFVSHHLITAITKGVRTIYQRRVRFRDAKDDYHIVLESQEQFQDLAAQRSILAGITADDIARDISAEVVLAIQSGLAGHKQVLKQMEYGQEPLSFLPSGVMPDAKQLAKDVAKIDAISGNDILKAIHFS